MKHADSPNQMEDSFNQLPEELKPEQGYHWDCYQRVTKNLDRFKSSTEDSETIQQPRTSGRASTAFEKVILKPDWYSHKEVIESDERRSGKKMFGQLTLQQCFTENQRFWFLCMLSSCGRQYKRNPAHWRSANKETKRRQENLEESHRTAFTKVCDAIGKEIIQGQRIMKPADLCEIYVSALE